MYVDFFFFQAEDGIRDIGVTGVQTCALPILACSRMSFPLPVTRMRFAVPLWVFCFGMSSVLVRVWRRRGTSTSRQHGAAATSLGRRRRDVWWCGRAGDRSGAGCLLRGRLVAPGLPAAALLGLRLLVPVRGDHHDHVAAVLLGVGLHDDRKSTRLNSSHANISYAVFCLKKK